MSLSAHRCWGFSQDRCTRRRTSFSRASYSRLCAVSIMKNKRHAFSCSSRLASRVSRASLAWLANPLTLMDLMILQASGTEMVSMRSEPINRALRSSLSGSSREQVTFTTTACTFAARMASRSFRCRSSACSFESTSDSISSGLSGVNPERAARSFCYSSRCSHSNHRAQVVSPAPG